jgi:pyrroline-5-carboxylate reductase
MGTSESPRIAFIGGGIMAEAFIRGMLQKSLAKPGEIIASDPLVERRALLAEKLGVRVSASNLEAASGVEVIVLAVKPQVLGKVLRELTGHVSPDILLLTFVAGAKMETIRQALGVKAIVRIMPNTPCQIGEGMSVWTATAETSPQQREWARQVVASLGEEVYVENEEYLDMATALNGSGPAYVFLFMEALIDAGVHLGLSRAISEKLVLQTVRGSAIYAQSSGLHPAVLRNMVTSPGGTTAEALYRLEEGGLRATISRAVAAAYEKAKLLGELSKR